MKQITFLNLKPSLDLERELAIAYIRVLRSGIYLNGQELEVFSHQWASYCDKKYCVLAASGLDALKLVLSAWSIRPGGVVYVPAWGCVQTWLAVEQVGLVPTPFHYSEHIEAAIRVHLYGAKSRVNFNGRNIKILEDACQAHGLELDGDPAVYSFYPTKNLGGIGGWRGYCHQ